MAQTWNTAFEAAPAGSDNPALGDNNIRAVKEAVRERIEKEHKMDLSTGTTSLDGWHKAGSALVYYGTSAPTQRPDAATALSADDNGRIWIHSTTKVMKVYVHGTGWVEFSAAPGTGWAAVLAAAIGSNWATALGAALGTGWTTALAAAATSGSANKIDADTVSGYGIGAVKTLAASTDLNTILINGFYAVATPTYTNDGAAYDAPAFGSWCVVKVEMLSSTYGRQEITNVQDLKTYYRALYNNSWYGWIQVWSRATDANGGQPPAPKPTASAVPGEWVASGVNAYTTPNVSGTYAVVAFKSGHYYSCKAGVVHNRDLNTEFSTTGIDAMVCWRTT